MKLTKDRDTQMMAADSLALPVKAGVKIFAGAMVAIDKTTGLALPAEASPNLIYMGRAEGAADTTGLGITDGALHVEVRRNHAFKWNQDGTITAAMLGQDCYMQDDSTVSGSDAEGTLSRCGQVIAIDGAMVWVEG